MTIREYAKRKAAIDAMRPALTRLKRIYGAKRNNGHKPDPDGLRALDAAIIDAYAIRKRKIDNRYHY